MNAISGEPKRTLIDWLSAKKEVPVFQTFEPADFENFRNVPVVFHDPRLSALADLWTPAFVRSQVGNVIVNAYVSADGTFPGGKGPYDENKYRYFEMTLSECIDRMEGTSRKPLLSANEKCYLYQAPLKAFDELVKDIEFSRFIGPDCIGRHFWLSGPGNITPLHYDMSDNLLAQVMGRKKILLWNPMQYEMLSFIPIGKVHSRQSFLDPSKMEGSKLDEFCAAQVYMHELLPGQVLYIPYAWPHYVVTEEFSASVNTWWDPAEMSRLRDAIVECGKSCDFASMIKKHVLQTRPELLGLMNGLIADKSFEKLIDQAFG